MTSARHKFQPTADSTLNITDHWQAATDPENERGEYAEALFRVSYENGTIRRPMGHGLFRETSFLCDVHYMIGATVEDSDEIRFLDRGAFPGQLRKRHHPPSHGPRAFPRDQLPL